MKKLRFLSFLLCIVLLFTSCAGSRDIYIGPSATAGSATDAPSTDVPATTAPPTTDPVPEDTYERREDLAIEDDGSSLRALDVSALEIPLRSADDAVTALGEMAALLDDDAIGQHVRLTDTHELKNTVYYRFDCLYDGVPVWNESIVLASDPDNTAGTLSANYRLASSADKTDVLTPEMAAASAVPWISDWLSDEENTIGTADIEIVNVGSITPDSGYYYPVMPEALVFAHLLLVTYKVSNDWEDTIELLFSGKDGSVLEARICRADDVEPAVGTNLEGSIQADISYDTEEERYSLWDPERKIAVYNGKKEGGGKTHSTIFEPVTSPNPLFGDTKAEKEQNYDKAIQLLKILQELKDFYKDQFNEDMSNKTIIAQYNDGFSDGINGTASEEYYSGETAPDNAWYHKMTIGYKRTIEHILVGHEFGHLIRQQYSSMHTDNNKEATAVSEALADIMSILSAWAITGTDPNWNVPLPPLYKDRNLKEGYTVLDSYSWDDGHNLSLKYSHSAYLMYEGGGENTEPINDIYTLLELWYRTSMLLTGCSTLADGRVACETAATQMMHAKLLTQKQLNCVLWAMDECGINYVSTRVVNALFREGIVNIYVKDSLGGPATNYSIIVKRVNGEYVDAIYRENAGVVQYSFPGGEYVLTVNDTDGFYPSVKALVVSKNDLYFANSDFVIQTSFGTRAEGRVFDSSGVPLDGVKVTAYPSNSYLGREPFSCVSEDGYYSLKLPPGIYRIEYEKDGYEKNIDIQNQPVEKGAFRIMDISLVRLSETETTASTSPVTASGTCGDDLSWELTDDGTLTISGTGPMWDHDMWESYWPSKGSTVRSAVFQEGVTSVGAYAFYNCTKLETVSLADSVTSIGDSAFESCISLKNVVIPDRVTSIGVYAFYDCWSLEYMEVPANVAFIGACAFSSCVSLQSISVSPDNPSFVSSDGVLIGNSTKELMQYPAGKAETAYTVPDGITVIDSFAFKECKLEEITLPVSLREIQVFAFPFGGTLKDVYFQGSRAEWDRVSVDLTYNSVLITTMHFLPDPTEEPPETTGQTQGEGTLRPIGTAHVGDLIEFGHFEQDNNQENGEETLFWRVLDEKDGKILVITEQIIDCRSYDLFDRNTTWEESRLREWLNGDFINSSLSSEEANRIVYTRNVNANYSEPTMTIENPTYDRAYILSIYEANQYFADDEARKAAPTPYAEPNSAYSVENGYCWWWLRTTSKMTYVTGIAAVDSQGTVHLAQFYCTYPRAGVRPVMWITR